MKLLYIHNSLPEYRYGFFKCLDEMCELTLAFTDIESGWKTYGVAINDERLRNFSYVLLEHNLRNDENTIGELIKNRGFDCIIIPALDDIYHVKIGYSLLKKAKENGIRTGLFWEKWRPDANKQPFKRKIKEFAQSCLIRGLLKELDIFWSPGRKTTEYLVNNGACKEKIHKIHDSSICPLTNEKDIRIMYNIKPELSIVLYFGRMVAYKGADVLIRAFSKTGCEFQNSHFLLIAGSGSEEHNFKQLAMNLGISNYRFIGFVDPADRASYFKASDVFVLPAKIVDGKVEAWGLTVNEAIQFNNIIVATDVVASAYELVNDKNGFIVRENSVDELTHALEKTVDEKIRLTSKKENLRITNEYTYKRMSLDIVKAIN